MAKREDPEEAFDRLLTQIEESGFIPDAVFPDESRCEPQTMHEFLGRFVGCGRTLSPDARRSLSRIYRERLGLSLNEGQLETYAKAARRVRDLRRGESRLSRGGPER